jgi:RNA polymerase sigma-70 factor, ECF subfamily
VTVADPKTDDFEQHRDHLQAVAYRMLGSVTEADDAVQESWLRLNRAGSGGIDNMRGWLTTVVARVCLDMLRSRQARREDYAGSWLPEPVVQVDTADGPEEQAVLADSVGVALLVVLDTLTPPERLALVLHDMFAVPYEEIAPMVDRTPTAARQLASRARRRVRGAAPRPDPDVAEQRRVVEVFLAASRAGDFDALLAVLDPEVVFRIDTGGIGVGATPPAVGAETVARRVLAGARPFAPFARPAIVNGAAGAVVVARGKLVAVAAFTVAGGRIASIDVVSDASKLHGLAFERVPASEPSQARDRKGRTPGTTYPAA